MSAETKTPPGRAGLDETSLRDDFDGSENSTNPGPVQAQIELLADDLTANVSAMRWSLETALANLNEPGVEVAGTLYALRRAKAYWRAISESARDLSAAEAARRSAARQGGVAS